MSEVWAVVVSDYECDSVESIWATEALAETRVQELKTAWEKKEFGQYYYSASVEPYTVDEPGKAHTW